MTLGDLMHVAAAFLQVYAALNWLAENAMSRANWSASARRVAALDLAYQDLEADIRSSPANGSEAHVTADGTLSWDASPASPRTAMTRRNE